MNKLNKEGDITDIYCGAKNLLYWACCKGKKLLKRINDDTT